MDGQRISRKLVFRSRKNKRAAVYLCSHRRSLSVRDGAVGCWGSGLRGLSFWHCADLSESANVEQGIFTPARNSAAASFRRKLRDGARSQISIWGHTPLGLPAAV